MTIFEKQTDTGGALRYALSPVRVSHDSVTQEVKRIEEMGAVFKFGTEVTDIKGLLSSQQFNDVYISPGLQDSREVDIGQKEASFMVTPALDFLFGANASEDSTERNASQTAVAGNSVVVIGGGSVAMDCAITAKELGATRVYVIALESLESLPADEDEICLARERGVVFIPETRVTSVHSSGRVAAIQVQTGENGKLVDLEGAESHILASTVIVAAGQVLSDSGKRLLSLEGYHNHVIVNTADDPVFTESILSASGAGGKSPYKKIFAGGDAVRGGGDTVVQAVADGKRAASWMVQNVQPAARKQLSLETEFCGVKFENPFCLSSSPVSNTADMIATAYDAGWGGAYYKTLNREDKFAISHPSPRLGAVHTAVGTRMDAGIQNMEQISDRPLADNLADILWLRKNYPNKVNGVSIMGFNEEDWAYLAAAAEVCASSSLLITSYWQHTDK